MTPEQSKSLRSPSSASTPELDSSSRKFLALLDEFCGEYVSVVRDRRQLADELARRMLSRRARRMS